MSNTIGWGKGSENNDIGWGQGAVNNNIGWGAIHELSYSGETNIVGGLADERFIMVVKSDNAGTSGTNQFTIPTTGTGYLYDVETSDGYTATGITGNHTITFPSGAGTHTVFITGDFPRIFFSNVGDKLKLLEVTNWGNYGISQAIQSNAFFGCSNLSQISNNAAWFDVVTIGTQMFLNCSITSLPEGMEFPLLISALSMFQDNSLTSLPEGMELPLLSNGNSMFRFNSLTSLPTGMTLPSLTNGTLMFQSNSLNSLPTGMTLPLLTSGIAMFAGCTINTTRYSQLLIDLESGNANNSVPFHGGNSKYNASGQIARNILTGATRLWTITDGGLEL